MTIRNYLTVEYVDGKAKQKQRPSNLDSIEFSSVKIGVSGLEIKETSTHFDFSARKLVNVAPGGVSGEVVEYGQYAAALAGKLSTSLSGVGGGLATLDGGGKIPATQLPNSVMELQGFWDATANNPTLADGTGNAGDVYLVSVSGTQDLGSGSQTFYVNDYAIYAGGMWKHSPAANAVLSVNGKAGVVILTTDDIGEGSTNKYFTSSAFNTAFSAKTTDNLTEGSTNKYYTASQARTDLIAQAITDGVTGYAPSEDVVFDALAGKSDVGHNHTGVYAPVVHSHSATDITDFSLAAKAATISQAITDGVTGYAPSEDVVFDALALKADIYPIETFTNKTGSGTPITIRQIAYQSGAGEAKLAQANASLNPWTVFLMGKDASIADNASGAFYAPDKGSKVAGFSGLDITKPIYLSRSSAGGYAQDLTGFVAGEHVVSLGKVLDAATIIFNPEYLYEY